MRTLEPLYTQPRSVAKTPLVYTQYRKAKLIGNHDHLTILYLCNMKDPAWRLTAAKTLYEGRAYDQ